LSRIGRRRSISAGQTLLWEGEESLLVANVIEGVLKLSTSTGDGREQIVGIVYPSDFVGRPFGEHSHHSVTALTDAKVCLFTRRDFDNFARQHPAVGHELLRRTLRELDRARTFMLLLGRKTAAEKVASLLVDMASRLSDDVGRFELPIGRQQMADLLGLTIETVSRQLTRMRNAGTIAIEGRRGVSVLDPTALAATAAI
jgi:CRP/FNR family transcriptional regulator